MSTQPDRIISLLNKQSEHPVRNSILFALGWVLLIFLGAVLMVVVVIPRVQGYVAMPVPEENTVNQGFGSNDLLVFQKLRQTGAQELNPGDIIAFQPDTAKKEYQVGEVAEVMGTGDEMQFTVTKGQPGENQTVTLDMVRGKLEYKLPFFGLMYPLTSQSFNSFVLVGIAQLLLIYAGWQIGTSMINARDPQRQARAARLRTAALAGNLETTRQRLRRQGLR
ncbi:MAG: S26 family signal peptidase [Mobiluncus porci]|uniref:S26 family signal peptidase n=1 Tax=Mobiluncus TaxID=2050 RepID=UPI0023F16EAE|nr:MULTISPECIES: S26 family signal peptidase [Mobiluncus]MCI6583897.1 S26 family signal peptidase [Mobiluncus sp.]MDD7542416.1 S26 family signal peptidase [Mobiluncus porci]MDY5747725.1 S26 family signal peptidase [Mobiluncus porci]